MDPVREALYDALTGDATLTGLLSDPAAVHHGTAPTDADYPFVTFHWYSGADTYTFGDNEGMSDDTWVVKALDRSGSPSAAEDIAARIKTVLNGRQLSIAGRTHLYLKRVSKIHYAEQDGAETIHHVGGVYRLVDDAA